MDGPLVSFQIKMRALEFMVIFFVFVLSVGNSTVNDNIAGRQTSSASVNFGKEIPIESGSSGATTGGGGGSVASALPVPEGVGKRNETSFANFLNDARYGRFGLGSSGGTGTSSSDWNFSPFTSRSRVVETKYGKVQGLSITLFPNIHYSGKNNPLKNKIVEVFLGIPYAAPPVKSYRFAPTQTPSPWNDVRPTTHPSPSCPQILPDIRNESAALKEMPKGLLEYFRRIQPYLRNQSEDCLYLNVFACIGSQPKLKPVIIFIHGGRFLWGAGNLIDGTVISSQADVIFVTINYRLGILGFLNMNESPSSRPRVANYGLMDQIAALHWIKENISNFGGDPDNITLLGYEAGAACIHFLMSSPAVAPGLFHRGILISGSAKAPWALISDPYAAAMSVAQSLNCSGSNSSSLNEYPPSGTTSTTTQATRESHHRMGGSSSNLHQPVLDCLKSKDFKEFLTFKPPKFTLDFGPSIDGIVITSNYWSAKEYQMGKREVSKKYDLLFGISSFERLTEFSEIDLEFGFEQARRDTILRTLVRNSYRFHRNEILATITSEATDWERTGQHPLSTRDLTINAVTDCLSLAPVVAAAESSQMKKSFFYVFEHQTRDGLYTYQRVGAGGGEELNYIFGYPLVEAATGQVLPFIPAPLPSNYSKSEIGLAELWLTFISNFAHSGDPNGPTKTDLATWPISKERNRYRNSVWEPYDRLHQKYLEISLNKVRSKSHYRAHHVAIFLRLVPELERSGAQIASTFHNRMRGGNDPSLYVGSLKHFPEDDEEEPPELMSSSIQLLELPLGYGYYSFGYNGYSALNPSDNVDGSLNSEDGGGGGGRGRNNNEINVGGGPPLFTTCYSPVSSSIQESSSINSGSKNSNSTDENSSLLSSFYLSPYSTVLAITIAIGCSLLLLNIFIFTLVYFRRGGRAEQSRPKTIKSSTQSLQQDNNGSNKYGEPPELLKSNTTTASSFLHASHSQSQLQIELEALELTVKTHQKELLGERAALETDLQLHNHPLNNPQLQQSHSLGRLSLSKSSQNLKDYQHLQAQQQQLPPHQIYQQQQQQTHPCHHPSVDLNLSSRGILLSPPSSSQSSSINVSSSNTDVPQTLAVATLPRCNGAIVGGGMQEAGGGGGSFVGIKPMPPPRSSNNFSTLPHMALNIPPSHQGHIQLSVDVVTSDEELRV